MGFIHLPVPFLGATAHPAIARISQSDEMRPWRLANDYDRPIPRRLVEEAGVARHLFGQEKKAVTIPMFGAEVQGRELSGRSLEDFLAYYRRHRGIADRLLAALVMRGYAAYLRGAGLANATMRMIRVKRRVSYRAPLALSSRVRSSTSSLREGRTSLLNQWAMERVKQRYHVQ